MSNPWGLSGPAFLWLYGGALVLVTVAGILLRVRMRRPAAPDPPPEPTVPVMAFLAGGAMRVVEAALARLIEVGAVRPARGGTVTAVPFDVRDPLDRAVHERLGTTPQWIASVRVQFTSLPEVVAVGEFLAARGIVLDEGMTRRYRFGTMAAFGVLAVIGFARLGTGIAGGYPVGYLVLELFATMILLSVFATVSIPKWTVHGERMVQQHNGKLPGIGHAVAAGGLFAFPDDAVRYALAPPPPPPPPRRSRWAAGAGGYVYTCGSSGGSSCGSSSGGGSSCGGGGGGGGCGGGG